MLNKIMEAAETYRTSGGKDEHYANKFLLEVAIYNALRQAYKAGWVNASSWANRDDLLSDIDSPSYMKDAEKIIGTGP